MTGYSVEDTERVRSLKLLCCNSAQPSTYKTISAKEYKILSALPLPNPVGFYKFSQETSKTSRNGDPAVLYRCALSFLVLHRRRIHAELGINRVIQKFQIDKFVYKNAHRADGGTTSPSSQGRDLSTDTHASLTTKQQRESSSRRHTPGQFNAICFELK